MKPIFKSIWKIMKPIVTLGLSLLAKKASMSTGTAQPIVDQIADSAIEESVAVVDEFIKKDQKKREAKAIKNNVSLLSFCLIVIHSSKLSNHGKN